MSPGRHFHEFSLPPVWLILSTCSFPTEPADLYLLTNLIPKGRRQLADYDIRMVLLSTDDLDESIRFYADTLGMALKFRDGSHYAALDGGSITLALATSIDHPMPGKVVVGVKTADVDAAAGKVEAKGGAIVKGPYNDEHERRAVVYDHNGNGLVFYSPRP